ncbi:hypothetical protein J7E99_20240 [Streptomyces sp. ISL-44]|uniref:hypothetical protein n=1 Tax=Streptomyces sp. ISL-44 TaxID=2819184 RepID=UPI001BE6DEF3|nr:hypothetical protein [Streptomyces sp. ISL-44]MBT2542973.1 hypothetical protein [Streptomyces sp. ISL-44]
MSSHTVLPRTGTAPALRGRIGTGFSPVPHRYRLYLSAGCPRSRQVAGVLDLLGCGTPSPRPSSKPTGTRPGTPRCSWRTRPRVTTSTAP